MPEKLNADTATCCIQHPNVRALRKVFYRDLSWIPQEGKDAIGSACVPNQSRVQVKTNRSANQDSAATGIDARQPVYDIRGSYARYQCVLLSEEQNNFAKTHNCYKYPATAGGYGRCYTDTFGDKHCQMTGGGPTQLKDQMPPPGL